MILFELDDAFRISALGTSEFVESIRAAMELP